MMKKSLSTAFVSLGIIQLVLQSSPAFADEECCSSPCYNPVILPGEVLDPCCVQAGYPLPVNLNLCCSWNAYASGDFLYLGSVRDVATPIAQRFTFVNGINFQIDRTTKDLLQNSSYKPGFRVAIGVDLDSVILDATYLRYYSHTTSHFNTDNNQGIALTTYAGSILESSLATGLPVLFSNVKSSFHLNVDRLLVSAQRPVYMGKRITMNLNYGLLAYWNEQKWDFNCTALAAPPAVFPPVLTSNGFATAIHKTWAVGPSLGFKAVGFLPCSFKAIFNIDLSLQYGFMYRGETVTSFPAVPFATNNTTITRDHAGYSQAVQNAEIGLGWGSYFGCDKYHFDLYATYNFFSQYCIAFGLPYSQTAVDLNYFSYGMQGIAIGGRLDF